MFSLWLIEMTLELRKINLVTSELVGKCKLAKLHETWRWVSLGQVG